jgi:hypothetical protein
MFGEQIGGPWGAAIGAAAWFTAGTVAVRWPSLRQLVMLYSEATGQKMPLSATTSYAGRLVEQVGNLYRQASY